jgi:putative endopeptidase
LSRDQSYAENVRALNAAQARRMLKRINKPVDPERWEMPPFIINAYFHPTRNEIVFPSAILQQPFFSTPTADMPHGDVAINFAAIGAVICHEISHGYDDQVRLRGG